LIEKALEIRDAALADKQYSAAVQAHKEASVLAGIRIERLERGGPGEFQWLDQLSIKELQLLAAGKLDIASYRKDDEEASRSRLN
jgi:hypothetical protein